MTAISQRRSRRTILSLNPTDTVMVVQTSYVPPAHRKKAFHCPLCHVFASQDWTSLERAGTTVKVEGLTVSRCAHCRTHSIWFEEQLVVPPLTLAPPHHEDMPPDVAQIYDEAASISGPSPRAAAALLRLAVEMLVRHLGGTGSLHDGIGQLVAMGLPPTIQKSLDVLRVTGNSAVHPGVVDLQGGAEMTGSLFVLLNLITEAMISQPLRVQELYSSLPENARKSIDRRDSSSR